MKLTFFGPYTASSARQSRDCAALTNYAVKNTPVHVPIKPFAYASVRDFIATCLLDEKLEGAMLAASCKLATSLANPAPTDTVMHDILDGCSFLNILGTDKKPFFAGDDPTLKLVFSLSVDWFGPRGLSKRNHGSIGLISLVCLNLPPERRYAPENLHLVGIIPGPKESHVQPYLAPLIDEFLVLYGGIHISSTALCRLQGRHVHAVLVPVVCDMQAARKVVAFVPPKASLACPYCKCRYEDMSRADMIDGHYEKRTYDEWKQRAEEYKACGTVGGRKKHKQKHGIAWSELLRLPYWDPTRFLLVDAMHNLFLGLLQFHVRVVWEIEDAGKKAKSKMPKPYQRARASGKPATHPQQKSKDLASLIDTGSYRLVTDNTVSTS